jgi:hypothetical protein
MKILSFLRKTLIKISSKKNSSIISSKSSSVCGKCCSNGKCIAVKYCKCCGKKIVKCPNNRNNRFLIKKNDNIVNGKVVKLKHSTLKTTTTTTTTTTRRRSSNLKILSTDLFGAKQAYRMNDYHISNFLPNENSTEHDVYNIKPRVQLKKGILKFEELLWDFLN